MNVTVCPDCLVRIGRGEEKSCGHGTAVGSVCVECGKRRAEADPFWSCLGSMRPDDPRAHRLAEAEPADLVPVGHVRLVTVSPSTNVRVTVDE